MLRIYFINVWNVLAELSFWLLFGVFISGLLHIFFSKDFISKHLGKSSVGNVFKAVFFGVPMPLCSCGVVPAAVTLKKEGASDGASTGFLISTPQTGIDSVFVSASLLGWPFALFKVVCAFITGVIGGIAVDTTSKKGRNEYAEKIYTEKMIISGNRLREFFNFVFFELLSDIWFWIFFGILVSGAITTFMPTDFFEHSSYMNGIIGKITVLIFSLGFYVCATGSVPIAASLVAAGMPVGSAIVFLVAGPATNIGTMGTILKTFGKRILFIYLLVIIIGSIVFGELFDTYFALESKSIMAMGNHHSVLSIISSVILIMIFSAFIFINIKKFIGGIIKKYKRGNAYISFVVSDLSCSTCAGKIKSAISKKDGVNDVIINVKTKTVNVYGKGLNKKDISDQIIQLGYNVV